MINIDFKLTEEQVHRFKTQGFLLLKQFYSKKFTSYISSTLDRYINAPTDKYQAGFSRLAFDMYDGDEVVIGLLKDKLFRKIINTLCSGTLILAT